MNLTRFGPFEPGSLAAGLALATPLLLLAAMFAGGTENPTARVAAVLAISGLALGAVAGGVFAAAIIWTHMNPPATSANAEEN